VEILSDSLRNGLYSAVVLETWKAKSATVCDVSGVESGRSLQTSLEERCCLHLQGQRISGASKALLDIYFRCLIVRL
jgi:hypothetical protein